MSFGLMQALSPEEVAAPRPAHTAEHIFKIVEKVRALVEDLTQTELPRAHLDSLCGPFHAYVNEMVAVLLALPANMLKVDGVMAHLRDRLLPHMGDAALFNNGTVVAGIVELTRVESLRAIKKATIFYPLLPPD